MVGICYHSNRLDQPVKLMELLETNLASIIQNFMVPMYARLTIIQDISRGLEYLHTRSPPIVHSYLTMQVILLTENLVAKIGGFTFSIEMVPEITKQTTHYIDNEILKSSLNCGLLFDIFSFGKLICEVVTRRSFPPLHKCGLIDIATGKLFTMHIFDSSQYAYVISVIENTSLKQLVSGCMNDNPDLRPSALEINETVTDMIKGEFYFPCQIVK